jgi:glycerate-2-kinase
VIHRVLVDIRYPSAPDIASTTHDEPRRRNPNVMAPRYHYIGDTGVITYGKAAHTLARAFTEEYYRSGMLVPDAATTPNPDNSTQ